MFLFTSFKTDNKIQLKTQNETQNIEKIELENKINPQPKLYLNWQQFYK
jgi:hypothetical protein